MYIPHFVYSFIHEGQLGCFHLLASRNNAALPFSFDPIIPSRLTPVCSDCHVVHPSGSFCGPILWLPAVSDVVGHFLFLEALSSPGSQDTPLCLSSSHISVNSSSILLMLRPKPGVSSLTLASLTPHLPENPTAYTFRTQVDCGYRSRPRCCHSHSSHSPLSPE